MGYSTPAMQKLTAKIPFTTGMVSPLYGYSKSFI